QGQLLEFTSTEISVDEDFPAWCRMTGNELVSFVRRGRERSFLVCKGALKDRRPPEAPRATRRVSSVTGPEPVAITIPTSLPSPAAAVQIPPLSVMGIGSWPRPRRLLRATHEP